MKFHLVYEKASGGAQSPVHFLHRQDCLRFHWAPLRAML